MRVRVSYIQDVSDNLRRAINNYHGQPGLASRDDIKTWFWLHGQTMTDDILNQLDDDESEPEEWD